MFRIIKKVLAALNNQPQRQTSSTNRVRLGVECMEDRSLPSGFTASSMFSALYQAPTVHFSPNLAPTALVHSAASFETYVGSRLGVLYSHASQPLYAPDLTGDRFEFAHLNFTLTINSMNRSAGTFTGTMTFGSNDNHAITGTLKWQDGQYHMHFSHYGETYDAVISTPPGASYLGWYGGHLQIQMTVDGAYTMPGWQY
jgi:hypothetical protein